MSNEEKLKKAKIIQESSIYLENQKSDLKLIKKQDTNDEQRKNT